MIVGTGTRANIFNPPTTTTLPQMLHDSGFDVCVLNWRSSIDLPAVEYTLDDAAGARHARRGQRSPGPHVGGCHQSRHPLPRFLRVHDGDHRRAASRRLSGDLQLLSAASDHATHRADQTANRRRAAGAPRADHQPPVGDSRASTLAEGAQRGDPRHPPRMPQRGSDSMAVVDPELRVYGVERCGSSTPARCPSCRRATAMRASS